MEERTPADWLRQQYFDLLPEARRVAEQLDGEVRYCLLPLTSKLARHEHLVIKSRIKDCESALGKLRRKQEGGIFDQQRPEPYSLTDIRDFVGVRIYAFPRALWRSANQALREWSTFANWTPDPRYADDDDDPLTFKYFGYCGERKQICGEVQLVRMLIGRFEDIEHSAVYKPSPGLEDVGPRMKVHKANVIAALKAYDEEFERLLKGDELA